MSQLTRSQNAIGSITPNRQGREDISKELDTKKNSEYFRHNESASTSNKGELITKVVPKLHQSTSKMNALQHLQKMREDIISNKDNISMAKYEEGSEDASSYWETSSKGQQSNWSSSVAYSSWSKMERNKVSLPPLESSVKKKPSVLPPPAIITANNETKSSIYREDQIEDES